MGEKRVATESGERGTGVLPMLGTPKQSPVELLLLPLLYTLLTLAVALKAAAAGEDLAQSSSVGCSYLTDIK